MARRANSLTDRKVRALYRAKCPPATSDGQGLTFTVSSTGYAAWVLRYTYAKVRKELTLGSYPDMSLRNARLRASEERNRIASGIDVAVERRRQREALEKDWKVRRLVEAYRSDVLAHRATSTRKLYGYQLDKWIVPDLGILSLTTVERADIVKMAKKASASGAGALRTLLNLTRSVFEHARHLGLVDANPVRDIKRSALVHVPPRRKGIALSLQQAKALISSLDDCLPSLALKLHLLTGVRPGELVSARWCEFSDDFTEWRIPDERTKTRNGYDIGLPTQATKVLATIRDLSLSKEYLFPAARKNKAGIEVPVPYQTYRGWLRAILDRLDRGFPKIKPHDLRRTFRSGLSKLGTRYEVAEKALNHRSAGPRRDLRSE